MSSLEDPEREVISHEQMTEKQEALGLFKNNKECFLQISNLVKNLNKRVTSGELEVDHGINLLDVKNQLMVQYILNLIQVVVLKSTGKTLEGSTAVDRLIENRIVIERIRPIEQKISYQIEKYLKISTSGKLDGNDPSRFRANPADLLHNSDENNSGSEDEENGDPSSKKKSDVYVPPKLSSVQYEGDETGAEKQKKLYERARKQALRSTVIQELKEEYLDTPVEIKATNSLQQKEDKYQKMKKDYEETYFTRIPVSKEEKKKMKRMSEIKSLGEDITNFEDTSVLHGGTSYLNKKKRKKITKTKGNFKKRRQH